MTTKIYKWDDTEAGKPRMAAVLAGLEADPSIVWYRMRPINESSMIIEVQVRSDYAEGGGR
jgi:hypothetical protein